MSSASPFPRYYDMSPHPGSCAGVHGARPGYCRVVRGGWCAVGASLAGFWPILRDTCFNLPEHKRRIATVTPQQHRSPNPGHPPMRASRLRGERGEGSIEVLTTEIVCRPVFQSVAGLNPVLPSSFERFPVIFVCCCGWPAVDAPKRK